MSCDKELVAFALELKRQFPSRYPQTKTSNNMVRMIIDDTLVKFLDKEDELKTNEV